MKSNYLLPNKYKPFGWVLFIIGLCLGVLLFLNEYEGNLVSMKVLSIYNEPFVGSEKGFFKIIENDVADELIAIAIIIGGLLVGFSKEKIEDEFIYKLRKDSLIWAILINYIILLLAIIFVYDFTFFDVLVFNMFTPLIFFIIRFNFLKFKANSHEE
jgi:hypothetical protein